MDPLTGFLALGLYLFGPRPKATQPKPDTRAIAAAQAEADKAKAEQARVEAELEKIRAQMLANEQAKTQREKEVLTYGQESNEMAAQALSLVPVEHRTTEVELAAEMVGRTGVSLSAILGQLRPDQRADLIKLVEGLLSRQAEERKAARALLEAKDKELAESAKQRAVLMSQHDKLELEIIAKEADAQAAKAERDAKDVQLRAETQKALNLMERIGSSRASFWKLCLWLVGAFLWFRLVLPALASVLPAAAWLQRFNAFIFHILTGK